MLSLFFLLSLTIKSFVINDLPLKVRVVRAKWEKLLVEDSNHLKDVDPTKRHFFFCYNRKKQKKRI